MISMTDFEDLSPEIFPSRGPSADCVARWEDDGGRPAERPAASGRTADAVHIPPASVSIVARAAGLWAARPDTA
ncbi:MAG: hypothetical protein CML03_06585 [Pseudooceanicola sp.]|nr:hypothetical protein [Pseudooceanicola sp.]